VQKYFANLRVVVRERAEEQESAEEKA